MAVLRIEAPKGRDFTASELLGRQIRIEGPVPNKSPPIGHQMYILADDEHVNNALSVELAIKPDSIVEAKLTLYHGTTAEGKMLTEEVTLRDDIEVSFSAIVSEVQ